VSPAPTLLAGAGSFGALARGEVSAAALVERALAAIAADAASARSLNAVLAVNPGALDEARRLDEALARAGPVGPLHGAPIVVKDNIDIAGLATTSGCRALAGAVPARDAACVRRLREAGAVILAKTNLSEFSFEIRSRSSLGGDVRNPFDRAVTAGGSSGGSAAALAAGFALGALGTDTGGSIRVPAAYCGLVGIRPTMGLIDRAGVAPLAPSTDTVGVVALHVDDARRLLAALAETPIGGDTARGLAGARLGVLRQAFGADAEIGAAMEGAIACMAGAGARIADPVELPDELVPIGGDHIVDSEFGPAFDAYLASNFPHAASPRSLAEIIRSGDYLPDHQASLMARAAASRRDPDIRRAILARHARLRGGLQAAFDALGLEALVYPTSRVLPSSLDNPKGGWAPELAACSGWPAITLPAGGSAAGLPIGLELLGPAGSEDRLLDLAGALETLLGPRLRPPPA
jgi:Asp-tRNA(Asn)/Glu-tRNA(Gln) amidotransferase A subunit family amidase